MAEPCASPAYDAFKRMLLNAFRVNDANALVSVPKGAEAISRYMSALTRALGLKSDSDFARLLKVPKTTLASWKRRGVIPDEYCKMIEESALPWIAASRPSLPDVSLTARAAVVKLLGMTGGNPLELDRFELTANAGALGGLLALAELLAELRELQPRRLISTEVDSLVTDMQACMSSFRQGVAQALDLSQ